MREKELGKGAVVEATSSVTTIVPDDVTINKAIVKKDVTKMAAEVKKAVAKAITEEKKETVKQEAKKEASKKEAPKKETAKKETAKKAPAKKEAKVGSTQLFVQFNDREVSAESIQKRVEAAYAAEGHKLTASDDLRIYIKPEENMLYYVVNNSYASGINLFE